MLQRTIVVVSFLLSLAGCSSSSRAEICNDGVDNDSKNGIDCADSACGVGALCAPHGLTCAADRTCSACSGNGGAAEANETICGDGLDTDCDGRIDCDDPDCQPSDGGAGKICDGLGHRCSAPDHLGHGTCTGSPGGGGGPTAALGVVRFVEADSYVLGTRGSGHREQATLTFGVTRQDGTPYAGVAVSFEHVSQGGSFIGVDPAACTTTAPRTCTTAAVSDGDGEVRLLLTSGTTYAALAVRATATAGGATRSLTAGGFTVVGAKPNGAHLSLDCSQHNIPALTHHDCVYSNYCRRIADGTEPGAVPCTVKLADRFGVVVGFPAAVGFRAEAGAVPALAMSKAFDVAAPAADVGHAVGYLEVCNSPLPFDVAPLPGEYAIAGRDWGCGVRTVNPRDGLVTLVAMVAGEEGFVDLDLDGRWSEGEPYVDLPEPFVDVDDDGVWEPGEWYLDADGDGAYSGPNGRWDADTTLWTQTRLLYTGYPAAAFSGTPPATTELFTRWVAPAFATIPPGPTPTPDPFVVTSGAGARYGVWFTDPYLNPLTPTTQYAVASATGKVQAKLTGPFGTADSIGASFRQLFCAGETYDASCREGPVEQGCRTSPCHVVWDVAFCRTGTCRFQHGNRGSVSLACAGTEVGADSIAATAEIDGVKASFWIDGQCVAE